MPATHQQLTLGEVADQATHAIRRLIHRTRPDTGGVAEPSDATEVIATLAAMTGTLPQLLDQLACSLEDEHHRGRLRVDDLAPLPDTAHTVHAVSDSLRDANECLQRAAAELDNAHQHAAHLARQPGPKFVQISGAKSLDETHWRASPRKKRRSLQRSTPHATGAVTPARMRTARPGERSSRSARLRTRRCAAGSSCRCWHCPTRSTRTTGTPGELPTPWWPDGPSLDIGRGPFVLGNEGAP